jgi:hypothetical protein
MNIRILKTAFIAILLQLPIVTISLAQTAPPPNLGEETKGKPAIAETNDVQQSTKQESNDTAQAVDANVSRFGTATVTESRRESGQVYRIELEHSAGAKQIIEENDSDGSIESTKTDIDDTPNLPKWTLGSW